MSKKARLPLLDDLNISSPCPISSGADSGKRGKTFYCSQCQKTVYDITKHSRKETKQLLDRHGTDLCLRLAWNERGKLLFQAEDREPPRVSQTLGLGLFSLFWLARIDHVHADSSISVPAQQTDRETPLPEGQQASAQQTAPEPTCFIPSEPSFALAPYAYAQGGGPSGSYMELALSQSQLGKGTGFVRALSLTADSLYAGGILFLCWALIRRAFRSILKHLFPRNVDGCDSTTLS